MPERENDEGWKIEFIFQSLLTDGWMGNVANVRLDRHSNRNDASNDAGTR